MAVHSPVNVKSVLPQSGQESTRIGSGSGALLARSTNPHSLHSINSASAGMIYIVSNTDLWIRLLLKILR